MGKATVSSRSMLSKLLAYAGLEDLSLKAGLMSDEEICSLLRRSLSVSFGDLIGPEEMGLLMEALDAYAMEDLIIKRASPVLYIYDKYAPLVPRAPEYLAFERCFASFAEAIGKELTGQPLETAPVPELQAKPSKDFGELDLDGISKMPSPVELSRYMKSLVVYYKAKGAIEHEDGVRLSGLIGQLEAAPGMLRLLGLEKKREEASRLYRIMRQVSRSGPEPRRDDLMVSVCILLFNIAPSERLIYHLSRIKPSDASDHLRYLYHAIVALNFLLMGRLDLASAHVAGALRYAGGRGQSAYIKILQGCNAIRQGDLDSAIAFLSEGSACVNGRIRAMASFYKGSVYFEKGDFRQAIRCFEVAGSLMSDAASLATVHSHMGACAVNLGDMDRAQREFEAMGRLTERLRSEHVRRYRLIADSYMGIVSRARGQYDAAMRYYKKAMKACIIADDKEGIANLLGNMGLLHQFSGDHAHAMQLFNMCLLYSERMGYWTGIEFSLMHMYRSLVSHGHKSEAARLRNMYVAKYPELHAFF